MHWAPPNRKTPLGIQGRSFQGQGSDIMRGKKVGGQLPKMADSEGDSLLDKFRKYEI